MAGQPPQDWNNVVPGAVGDCPVDITQETRPHWSWEQAPYHARPPGETAGATETLRSTSRTISSQKTKKSSWVDEHLATGCAGAANPAQPRWRLLLQRTVHSTAFTVVSTMLICTNTVLMGIETEHGGDEVGWLICEASFMVCYTIELLMRFGADTLRVCMQDKWIRFDTTIVVVAYFDMCLLGPLLGGAADARTMALVIRTLRLVKLARIVRLLRIFKELWLLVSSFISAFKTLTWTFFLLLLVIYVFGIVFVKLLGKETDSDQLRELFGSLPGAMFTLFQITTLEGWPEIAREVWETDQWYMTAVLLCFMMVSTFAIMNTVLAVIVEHTLTEAIEQRSDMAKRAQAQLRQVVEILADVYKRSDGNADGILTKEEFVKGLENNKNRKLLQLMELGEDFPCLDPEELGILFDTIDVDESGELTPQEFIKGIVQMRGSAKARGVFELRCDLLKNNRRMHQALGEMQGHIKSQGEDLVLLERQRKADFGILASRLDAIQAKLNSIPSSPSSHRTE